MEHIAILAKKYKLLEKILRGEKTIESRWYTNKKAPYKAIQEGEIVFFKESGMPVSARAEVDKALFFELSPSKVKEILEKYGAQIGVDMSYYDTVKDKRYCTLVFLKNVKKISPFDIDKKGFGLMAAWISIDNVEKLKK